jgi:hypothetical protein
LTTLLDAAAPRSPSHRRRLAVGPTIAGNGSRW